jgi:hypothetical protein
MQFYAADNEEYLHPVDGSSPREAALSYCWDWGPSESLSITVGWGLEEDGTLTHVVDYWVEIENDEEVSAEAMRPRPNAGALDASYRMALELDGPMATEATDQEGGK